MLKETFCQFILKQISRSNMNRMNLANFTRILRNKVQDVPSSQLMYVYSELQKLKSHQSQFLLYSSHVNDSKSFTHVNNKPMMKLESYQKQTVICLEEIAIKLKEKTGFEEGVDLCKLLYLRLLNVLEFNLPYINLLEQFREQFLWRDLGQEVIDYLSLIQKDPTLYSSLFQETVNLIIQQISDQLDNIDVLQLPYLKFVLSKAKKYQAYNITDQLLQRLDSIIDQNRFAFTFGELEKSLTSPHKNHSTLHYYALLNKDMTDKKLNYLYIDSCNDKSIPQKTIHYFDTKKQIGLPGKPLSEDQIDLQLRKIENLSFYGAYLDIFANLHQNYKLKTISLTKQYIKYHFQYFSHSGNLNCDTNQVIQILSNTIKNNQNPQQQNIHLKHLPILRLFFLIQMLLRNQVSGQQLKKSHLCLAEDLDILKSMQKPKLQHVQKIFDQSIRYFRICKDINQIQPVIESFATFVTETKQNELSKMINQELDDYEITEKTFVMNELIIYLISSLKNQPLQKFTQSAQNILEIFIKAQFKKYSPQAMNVQKVIAIVKQAQSFNASQKMSDQVQKQLVAQAKRDQGEVLGETNPKINQDPKSSFF